MQRHSALDYIKAILIVMGINAAGVVALGLLEEIVFPVYARSSLLDARLAYALPVIWLALIMGFLQGRWLVRGLSSIAVPVGGFLTTALPGAFFVDRGYWLCPEAAFALIALPALAALAARRGALHKSSQKPGHLLWMAGMLVFFTALSGFAHFLCQMICRWD